MDGQTDRWTDGRTDASKKTINSKYELYYAVVPSLALTGELCMAHIYFNMHMDVPIYLA